MVFLTFIEVEKPFIGGLEQLYEVLKDMDEICRECSATSRSAALNCQECNTLFQEHNTSSRSTMPNL